MIIDRRRKYREAELVRWRQQLEALLADEREIPSLNEVAGRLNCSTESLLHHFPDLCKTLVKHRLHDEEIERTKLRQKVEAILASEEEPPSSLSEVARRLGCRLMHLYIFPDLASKIVARYTTFKNQRAQQVMKQLCKEVREITFQIYLEENCYPSRNLVYSRFSKPGYFRNQKIRSAYHQALRDLGLLK